MKYFDKKSGKPVVLTPSPGEYLVKFREGHEGEALVKGLSRAERLTSTKWVPRDYLMVVTFEEEAVRSTSVKNTLDEIRKDADVEDVMPVFRDEEGFSRLIVPGRLLVAYKPGAKEGLLASIGAGGFKVAEEGRYGNWVVVGLPAGMKIEDAIVHFNGVPGVEYSEPVYYGVNDAEEAVSGTPLRWNLADIDVADAWSVTTGVEDMVAAVIDGRPDINHPALKESFGEGLSGEWDFSGNGALSSHSTQIVSILVAKGDEVKGISPGIRVVPLMVNLESQYYHQRADAIHYLALAAKKGEIGGKPVKRVVANCSWRTSGDVAVIREAIVEAASAGVIFVTSAGNDGHSGPHYPSDYSQTIKGVYSVAALAPTDRKADYSNYSSTVNICAPGGAGLPFDADDIYCADLNNTNSYTAGTSFAAPHLAGTIALMLSVNPRMDADAIKGSLERTAMPIKGPNPELWPLLGAGKLNAGGAVKEAGKETSTPAPGPVEPTEPTAHEGPEAPAEPTVPEAPATTPEAPAAEGPTVTITVGGVEEDRGALLSEIAGRVASELEAVCSGLGPGAMVRITIEAGGTSSIFEYAI